MTRMGEVEVEGKCNILGKDGLLCMLPFFGFLRMCVYGCHLI